MTRTKTEHLVAAFAAPFQLLEDAQQQLLVNRTVDSAIGVQLTTVGKLVGQPRQGVTDDDIFRRYVRARIAVNKSDGTIEDILTVSDLVVYDDNAIYIFDNRGIASFNLRVTGIFIDYSLAALLISFLKEAASAGVRVVVEFDNVDAADTFAFAGDGPGKGWDDTVTPTAGGQWANAVE